MRNDQIWPEDGMRKWEVIFERALSTVADEISAIDYAISNGAKIINASLGGYDPSLAEKDAISNANSTGILLVAAAGNDGINNDSSPNYPSSYHLANIIAVASTDQNDHLSKNLNSN